MWSKIGTRDCGGNWLPWQAECEENLQEFLVRLILGGAMSYRLAFVTLIAFQFFGCADVARWVRQYTYPPEFRYIELDDVRATMRELAAHSRELNQLIKSSDGLQAQRSEIISHLGAMEQAAGKLDQSGWPTNHPLIDMNLPSFRRDIKFAREAIEREPPNYLLAGPVTGACVYCHGGR